MSTLDFTLSMIDKVTQPLKAVQAGVTQFAETSQQAFKNIAVGGAGLAGSVFALKNVLDPALAIQDALDMAKVTGVDDGAMKKITDEALTFSAQYGKSAVKFVESSLSIRKAISGISDNELPQLTKISNITASALKTTAEESNAYMGKMFSQFQGYADSVGKVTFAEELAGKAVIMSQTFGTSMAEITDLMEGARSAGTQFGVGIDEQLAVLGELQRSLGTESSSAYESFLSGATDGAKKLGLSFVNASGQMLTMPEMLEKLQGKYGKSIAGNLKAQKEIEDAFGDSAIVVKSLFNNVDVLRKNISALGGDDGMKRATEMASMLANPWERLLSIWESIRIAVGMTLLPVIVPLINKIADMGQMLVRWLTLFPNIARAIGYVVTGFIAFTAMGAMANIVLGIGRLLWVGILPLWKTGGVLLSLMKGKYDLVTKATGFFSSSLAKLTGFLNTTKIASFATALGFTSITWPVLLLIGLFALVAIAVVKFWQPIKEFFKGFVQGFLEAFDSMSPVGSMFGELGKALGVVWEAVKTVFNWFTDLLTPIEFSEKTLNKTTIAGQAFGKSVAKAIELLSWPLRMTIKGVGLIITAFINASKWISQTWNDLKNNLITAWSATVQFLERINPVSVFASFWDSITRITNLMYAGIAKGWNAVCQWFVSLSPVQAFIAIYNTVSQLFADLWNGVAGGWNALCGWFENFSISDTFNGISDSIKGVFDGLWNWLSDSFNGVFNAVASKLNYLPGINIDLKETETAVVNSALPSVPVQPDFNSVNQNQFNRRFDYQPSLLTGGDLKGINKGGLNKEINNNQTSVDNRRQYGNITINNGNVMSPADLEEWSALN